MVYTFKIQHKTNLYKCEMYTPCMERDNLQTACDTVSQLIYGVYSLPWTFHNNYLSKLTTFMV